MKGDLAICPVCKRVCFAAAIGCHSPLWIVNAAGRRELRDCAGNLVPQSHPKPKEQ
jgi:hypothetical protein